MKKIIIKSGEYTLSKTVKIRTLDTVIVGEQGALLIPAPNILAFQGIGEEDILCSNCDFVLANRILRSQIQISIKCPSCGKITVL
jgi:hypothetical protein